MKRIALALAALLMAVPAMAQVNPQNLPANTVVGRLGVGPGPSQAVPFANLTTNLFNSLCTTSGAFPVYFSSGGSWVCSTVSGTPATLAGSLSLNPSANSLSPGLSITQSIVGSSGFPPGNAMNLVFITSDNAALTGANFLNGFQVTDAFGGSTMQGGRQAIAGFANLSAASNASNANRNYVGVWGNTFSAAGDGGTNTGAGALGALFGIGGWGDAQSGATNLLGVAGGEFNVSIRTGASAKYKTGVQIVQHSLDAVAGASLDALLALSSQGAPATGVNFGTVFGDFGGGQPVKSTGTLIGISNPNSTTTAVATGIDFSAATFSSAFLKGPGFSVDGTGHLSATNQPLMLGGFADNINANSVGDTQITIFTPTTNYRVAFVVIQNTGTTASLTTAQYGIFSASGGGGTALSGAGSPLTALTANTINTTGNIANLATANQMAVNFSSLFFRITTAQGAAATINVYFYIQPLP